VNQKDQSVKNQIKKGVKTVNQSIIHDMTAELPIRNSSDTRVLKNELKKAIE
jgi:hypothetical protein